MNNFFEKIIICLFGVLLGVGFRIIQEQSKKEDFDCPTNYKGQIVMDRQGNKFIISNGCKYSEVLFPSYFNYSLGDTVGLKTFHHRLSEEALEAENRKLRGENTKLMIEQFND